ncbi:MAG: phenylalanine--tRNA ligase subunit beta [Myxococcota bacterium]
MKASLEWIKSLVPELKANAATVQRRLDQAGVAVDGVHRPADDVAGVIVGEVSSCEPHPESDKLKLTTVFDGQASHPVVCGAANVAVGQKVAFAPVGISLPNGLHIEPRKIRGRESMGMICAADELGLALRSEGIMVLKPRSKPGRPVAEVLRLNDVIYELDLTPNRADLLSHFGLARELSALFELRTPKPLVHLAEARKASRPPVKIELEAKARCPFYGARVIRGLQVGPSPLLVQQRLLALGQRPVSNVVDATNLVLLELGHPLHAFDLSKLQGGVVRVRTAVSGEALALLDGSRRKLNEEDLVIADGEGPIALAGVMGGADSEVGHETTDILLESAWFDPTGVRRTGRRHGLHTEASHRFERGVDPAMVQTALDTCAGLIAELAGGTVEKGRIEAGRLPDRTELVPIRPERATALVGRSIGRSEIREGLKRLGLRAVPSAKVPKKLQRGQEGALWYRTPSWRQDLHREVDLIEEVARLQGYDEIPSLVPPASGIVRTEAHAPRLALRLQQSLTELGFYETLSLGFCADRDFEAFSAPTKDRVELANPLGEETAFLRFSVLPALLAAARRNQDQLPSRTDLRMFELGRSFRWGQARQVQPVETPLLGLVMRGRRFPSGWGAEATELDVFDLKGVLESLLLRLGYGSPSARSVEAPHLHPRSAGVLSLDGQDVGAFGELHPDVAEAYGLEGPPLFVAELILEALESARRGPAKLAGLSNQPPAQRDLSFFVSKAHAAGEVLELIRASARSAPLETVELFDVYEGEHAPEGSRSLAVAMSFRAPDRTLKDEEVEAAQREILEALEAKFSIHLRSA